MPAFCLEVAGDFACFTRPEMKVERVSYDVITPSAARAIFEAILWKPAIRWQIRTIEVLNPICWTSIRRNEVAPQFASPRSGAVWIEEKRQQRASLLLRDVRYRLHAELLFIPPELRPPLRQPAPERLHDGEENGLERQSGARPGENEAKYLAIFARRAAKGQQFMQPYLGCREFSCSSWRLVLHPEAEKKKPITESRDLGFMLYDLDFSDPADIRPMFYRAHMAAGVIAVPPPGSPEVLR